MAFTITSPSEAPKVKRRCPGKRARISDHAGIKVKRSVLGTYTDRCGRLHEVVVHDGAGGSRLVVDRDAVTLGDRRLVAHLGNDEPGENAQIVCREYLNDERGQWCRPVRPEDLGAVPDTYDEGKPRCETGAQRSVGKVSDGEDLVDGWGRIYRLELLGTGRSMREVRWQELPPRGAEGPARVVSVREVVGALESYEPARSMSRRAVARYEGEAEVSVCLLRGDLERVWASRIVLNRGLREAVVEIAAAQGLSFSEIAMRCGRVKRDAQGNVSGETSWLSRRLGLVADSGKEGPSPWVHSDVLGLIARQGINVAPREVELD